MMPKILVVDDDQDLVYMIKAMLEKNGYDVTTAADGDQALKAVKTNAPDLMIIDLSMPVMDGWRLGMKVRQQESCKNLPIIVLSGLIAPEESQSDSNEPYNIYMAKPFDILKLMDRVKGLLAGGKK
jgi:CheY-like chemotaxis protein